MHMPAVVTLDDLAAMNAADPNGHRCETSPEGVLSVVPPPDSEHCGDRWSPGRLVHHGGGRIPDLTVWSKPPARSVWLPVAGLPLVIEIVSPGSETMDGVTKRREYAAAGISQYWVVDRDDAQTVTLYRLASDGTYAERAETPLAWPLQTKPADHLD